MSYLGRSLTDGNYLKLDDIQSQFNSVTTTFNLTSGGQALLERTNERKEKNLVEQKRRLLSSNLFSLCSRR
jgi:hypothetical protein